MTKVGLLSDTHGWLHPRVFDFFKDCDIILHAGDIGNIETADDLTSFKPFRAVYGNIDDFRVRQQFPEILFINIEDVKVLMTHIGGYPGHYANGIRELIIEHKPNLFISGHSHILKVVQDKKYKLLHLNPGAAGKSGFHAVITMMRFNINGATINDLEILEIERNKIALA